MLLKEREREKKGTFICMFSLVLVSTCHDETGCKCVLSGLKPPRVDVSRKTSTAFFFKKVRPYRTAERDVSKLDPLSGFTERQEIPMSVM